MAASVAPAAAIFWRARSSPEVMALTLAMRPLRSPWGSSAAQHGPHAAAGEARPGRRSKSLVNAKGERRRSKGLEAVYPPPGDNIDLASLSLDNYTSPEEGRVSPTYVTPGVALITLKSSTWIDPPLGVFDPPPEVKG